MAYQITPEKLAFQERAMILGKARIAEQPEIYIEFKASLPGMGYAETVQEQIIDLHDAVPELEIKQLAELIGVSTKKVNTTLKSDEDDLKFTGDGDAATQCAAELAALNREHFGRKYPDWPAAVKEYAGQGLPMRRREIFVPLP